MLRFVSHLEMQHFFSRLVLRAQVPVYFSQGFNPRPGISLPIPRSVGIGSLDDRVRIELEEAVQADEVLHRLSQITPAEMTLKSARVVDDKHLEHVSAIEWQIDVAGSDLESVSQRIEQILSGPCEMPRETKKGKKYSADLRPLIMELTRQDDCVRAKVAYTPQGSIKPGELLEILHLPKNEFLGRMTRIKTNWN